MLKPQHCKDPAHFEPQCVVKVHSAYYNEMPMLEPRCSQPSIEHKGKGGNTLF